MTIDYYYTPGSSPCRAVLLTAKAVGVDLNLKVTDLMKGEHMTPEFLKINPQHCVPTLVDNGFVLLESRAMMLYLVEQYGKNSGLLPTDPKERAVVNQRLFFDLGTLYQKFAETYYPVMFAGQPYDPEKAKALDEAYKFFDGYLGKSTWAAGDKYTLADIALVATVSTADAVGYDLSRFPNVKKWYEKVKTTAKCYQEANQDGADKFRGMYQALTAKK